MSWSNRFVAPVVLMRVEGLTCRSLKCGWAVSVLKALGAALAGEEDALVHLEVVVADVCVRMTCNEPPGTRWLYTSSCLRSRCLIAPSAPDLSLTSTTCETIQYTHLTSRVAALVGKALVGSWYILRKLGCFSPVFPEHPTLTLAIIPNVYIFHTKYRTEHLRHTD